MAAIRDLLDELKTQGATAFMPFLTAGDPNLAWTAETIRALDQAGCHLMELGFPYSDPIADGPVIQESYFRALTQGISTRQIMQTIAAVTPEVKMPLVAMVSYSIVYRWGIEEFIGAASAAGFRGMIVPDLPIDEASNVRNLCIEHSIDWVPLITPTTPEPRAAQIAASATGFVYYVSVAGTTGERSRLDDDLPRRLDRLRGMTDVPIAVGFGVSSPEQAAQLRDIADGVIVGSALVRKIAESPDPTTARQNIVAFCERSLAALK